MSIFAPLLPVSIGSLAELFAPSSTRFGGEEEDEEVEEDEDAGEPSFDLDGVAGEDGLDEDDFEDFEEVGASSGSGSSTSHAAAKKKAKKHKKKKKKLTCAKRLALIEQARSRMWSFNIGDPERAHWERIANARKRAMAKAFCSGVPL
jgi:hypothetical protein